MLNRMLSGFMGRRVRIRRVAYGRLTTTLTFGLLMTLCNGLMAILQIRSPYLTIFAVIGVSFHNYSVSLTATVFRFQRRGASCLGHLIRFISPLPNLHGVFMPIGPMRIWDNWYVAATLFTILMILIVRRFWFLLDVCSTCRNRYRA